MKRVAAHLENATFQIIKAQKSQRREFPALALCYTHFIASPST